MKKILLILIFNLMLMAEVGKITALKGNIKIIRGSETIVAKNGMIIEERDEIKSLKRSKAQIIFTDETVITIGQNTTFKVEEYFYEADNKKSKTKFGIAKGVFKAITGQIGKISRDKFKIKTKTATIGIRGTTFMGVVEKKYEKIACTRGEISVKAKGREVSVKAGEITSFQSGETPSTPIKLQKGDLEKIKRGLMVSSKVSKKIQSITLGENLKPDSAKLKEILSEITKIKDNDVKMAALDELEAKLNVEYELFLTSQNIPINIETDINSDLKWGFYKNVNVIEENGVFKVDDGEFNSIYNLIEATGSKYVATDPYGFIEVWRDSNFETEPANIAEFMGYDLNEDKIYEHWNGEAGSKKVANYSGKILGSIKYLDNYSLINNSKVNLTLDFANRFIYGYLNFNASEPNSQNIDSWKLGFASIGSSAITPSGFYPYPWDMSSEGSSVAIFNAEVFFNRYYGEGAKEISGYFQISANDEYTDESSYYEGIESFNKDAFGVYIAKQSSIFDLKARVINSNDYFSWGYWARDDLGNKSESEILNAFSMGAWIKPNDEITLTSNEVINGYIQNSVIASYSGEVLGTVHYPLDGKANDLMRNGEVNLNFDFAKNSIDGKINFDAGNDAWRMSVNEGQIDGNKFDLTNVVSLPSSSVDIDGFEGGGKFYGNDAQRIGGGFTTNSTESKIAIGAFQGSK